jgi:acetyl-CoA C-acetyltransferase
MDAYIVSAVRTAGGRRGGRLAGWHPVDLSAKVIDAVVERVQPDFDSARVDDVIWGCVGQAGEQAANVGRNAVLASRLPESVPATTIDRQCGSSQQAIHFAAQAVMSGQMDVVIAGGVESMTRVPMFMASSLPFKNNLGYYYSPGMQRRYPGVSDFSQFAGAEMVARKYGLDKAQLDAYALQSHRRAAAATQQGWFDEEILALSVLDADGRPGETLHARDEGIRADATLDGIAAVKLLVPDGLLTAATASQLCDGASAVMVVNEAGLKRLGVKPMARIHHMAVLGHDPVIMLEAPIPATARVLARAGLRIDDIDLYEVNEAFASIPLAWLQATGADPGRLNAQGGAIALGHPLGASGTKLMTTLLYALRRQGKRYGLQTMCEGGGMANVTIVENLQR